MNRFNARLFEPRPMLYWVTYLFLCNFLCLGVSSNIVGQTLDLSQDVFSVANIYVDVTDKTASSARKKALAIGERKAFDMLLKRLTLRIDYHRLPDLDAEKISTFIQDFGVTEEKNSEIRYLANLTYRFKPNVIRDLLRDSEVQFAETISKPILVLPVYQLAGAAYLWDNPNPWRDSWLSKFGILKSKKKGQMVGLVPMLFGNGDLNDIATISAELAVKGDIKSLAAIARKYDVAKTLVAIAILKITARGTPVIEIQISRYDENSGKRLFTMQTKAREKEDVNALLKRATMEVINRVEELWKVDNLLKFEKVGVIAVTLPIDDLIEWVEAKRRLMKIAVIENIELVIFSRKEVRFNVHFIGDAEQLQLALAQLDMDLNEKESGWILGLQAITRSDVEK